MPGLLDFIASQSAVELVASILRLTTQVAVVRARTALPGMERLRTVGTCRVWAT